MTTPSYVELHARSAFSFLRGASPPERLVEQAASLDLPALAVCDRDGVYGAARVHTAAREKTIRPIVGAEVTLEDGGVLPLLVASRAGYRNLCRLITQAKLRGTKQDAPVHWADLAGFAEGLVALTGDEEGPVRRALQRGENERAQATVRRLKQIFGEKNVFVEIQRQLRRGENTTNESLIQLAGAEALPLLATNGVLYATPEDRAALDVFTCTREHTHLDAAGQLLAANAERYLKTAAQMSRLFADRPEAVANTLRLAERLEFSFSRDCGIGYEFPKYRVPEGETMDTFLRKMVMAGARARYSHLSRKVADQIELELKLIAKLEFSGYFLIVWDLVNFCTENRIMVQGRGSAANSVVCYALGITACDPIACELLFERFLTDRRSSWPDIDLDLPSGDRREKVIQEVYRRYGPDGAAMTANVITYRGKSAMREIGKALGFEPETLNRFSHLFANGDFPHTMDLAEQLQRSGVEAVHPRAPAAVALYHSIHGLPRHLGQHSGGMIICQGQLDSIVPLERASMPGRVVAQWDKDDCEDLGIIKVDLLGLGMMAVMQETFELCAARGRPVDLAAIPKDDGPTYDLMCAADTIGVFQIESRAQMATLPRMQPRRFYDVVIEVAIIRPGPIQGNMLHPYLARRAGKEAVTYYEDRLEPVLKRTLGVPLFQEQLLKMAMVMAGFEGSEAEELRRALSFHRSEEKMNKVCVKLRAGMERHGTRPEVIEAVTKAVQSFAVYGFPESHAISFAILAYASCWLKVHRAAEFFAGLLNNQPMGFYSPATLVADAKRHGLRILPVSVLESEWFCTVEENDLLRLGLCYVHGLKQQDGERIVAERNRQPFTSLVDFQLRTRLSKAALRTLSKIGALNTPTEAGRENCRASAPLAGASSPGPAQEDGRASAEAAAYGTSGGRRTGESPPAGMGFAAHRRDAQWKTEVLRDPDDLFARVESTQTLPLAPMSRAERLSADYTGTGLTVGKHPMAAIRTSLPDVWRAADLLQAAHGTHLKIAGQVICRQRPGTAKGFVFVSLEDETGVANAIVTPQLFERYRLRITEEPFLIIEGLLQNVDHVIHIKARHIEPLPFHALTAPASHDFR